MEQKTDRLYPSAPLENNDLEQRPKKKLNDINSFNSSIKNIKEMITYFKDKNNKSKKIYENYQNLKTVLESVDIINYYWSNVNFYNFIEYWYWFGCFTNISWYCWYSIIR